MLGQRGQASLDETKVACLEKAAAINTSLFVAELGFKCYLDSALEIRAWRTGRETEALRWPGVKRKQG